jgi:hypothetical protein
MNELVAFLKNDIRGLIILAVASSLFAALLYDSLKRLSSKVQDFWQKNKTKKHLAKYIKNYSDGYTAGYAWNSSYQQSVLVGHYLIGVMIQIGAILFLTICFVASLIQIGQPFSWIITIVFSILLTLQYKRLKEKKEKYALFMDRVFGEDFKEGLKKNAAEEMKEKIKKEKK